MSKRSRRKELRKQAEQEQTSFSRPWIPMKTGLILLTLISVVMAGLTAYSANPELSLLERILWGVLLGTALWIIFFAYFLFSRWLHKSRNTDE